MRHATWRHLSLSRCERAHRHSRRLRGSARAVLRRAMSALERAPRERKEVVNFMPAEVKVTEEIVVPKGSGERLGDIDNVKIKIDKLNGGSEELKTLHRLCYGRPGKQTTVKKFLRDFCGFAADADLAKKEETIGKLDGKMIKALLSTCDVSTSGTKKDNTSALAAFLQAPFASGKKSLAVKAGEKRKKAENKKARAEKKKGKRGKKAKAGGASALKRPPSAYLLYCNNKRAKVVGENPEAKATQIMQILAEKWKGISAERRCVKQDSISAHP